MSQWIIPISLLQPSVLCFLEKKKKKNKSTNLKKNNNLRKKLLKSNLPQTSELSYPQVSHMSFYKKKKNFISLGSRSRVVACKRKLLLVKYFHIKQQYKKIDIIKKESYHPLRM
jgi:hypothetical protein